MTWMFGNKDEIALPMQATLLMKNLEFIKFEFNGQRHLGRSLIALISLALLILCQAQAADTGVPSQAENQSNEWDRPFSQPFYLLHEYGYEEAPNAFVKSDVWFISDKLPYDRTLTVESETKDRKYYIDEFKGPYYTRREICDNSTATMSAHGYMWAVTLPIGKFTFVLANPVYCKDLSSTGENRSNASDGGSAVDLSGGGGPREIWWCKPQEARLGLNQVIGLLYLKKTRLS